MRLAWRENKYGQPRWVYKWQRLVSPGYIPSAKTLWGTDEAVGQFRDVYNLLCERAMRAVGKRRAEE